MKFILRIFLRIVINALALYCAARLIEGFRISSDWLELLKVSFWLGIANFFLKPILKLISLPLIILSLGLFTILINTAMLLLVDYFSPYLTIEGFIPAFKAVFLIGLINLFFSKTFLKD